MQFHGMQASGLAAQALNILFQVCFGPSHLHALVSRRDCAISQRTVMNNAGKSRLQWPAQFLIAGKTSVKVEPLPSSLLTVIEPLWESAISLTIDNPSPVPPTSLVLE